LGSPKPDALITGAESPGAQSPGAAVTTWRTGTPDRVKSCRYLFPKVKFSARLHR
jgi:hypothetical protein